MPESSRRKKNTAPPVDERTLEQRYEIVGVYLISVGLLTLISLLLADPGTLLKVAREALWTAFGRVGGFVVPIFLLSAGWQFLRRRRHVALTRRVIALILASVTFCAILSFFERPGLVTDYSQGGALGVLISSNGVRLLSRPGTAVALAALVLTSLILVLDKPLATVIGSIPYLLKGMAGRFARDDQPADTAVANDSPAPSGQGHNPGRIIEQIAHDDLDESEPAQPAILPPVPQAPPPPSPFRQAKGSAADEKTRAEAKRGETPAPQSQLRLKMSVGRYELPSLGLLDPVVQRPRKPGKVAAQAKQLEETLASFGVSARVIEVHSGPAVTRYDLQPAPGVKVSRIVNLADDLALALAARGLRIEAPVPGKAAVGIEVPNSEVSMVTMREVLESEEFQRNHRHLSAALGRDIAGETVVADLPRLPHLLIAGATGSGKSVCVNTILASILFTATPDEVRLIMVDPKRVELAVYNNIPHLLSPVVTEPKKAAAVLKQVVMEMETRYKMFAEVGARDLERYNASAPAELRKASIVVIIDELADLMMVSPADVEESICRLAQMARATGIHLVIATQRPSVDVITGLIKANVPSRIAFAVSSQIDSRTILDSAGAEKLLGRGDMLFAPVGSLKPLRVQGAYISDREIERLVAFWKGQGQPAFDDRIVNAEAEETTLDGDSDDLFYDALRIVVDAGQASASLLQRKLRIGYSRAGRLIDMMESRGLIGGADGSRARDVLINGRQLEDLMNRRTQTTG